MNGKISLKLDKVLLHFFSFIIHMCIQGLVHFSPLKQLPAFLSKVFQQNVSTVEKSEQTLNV
jgi:hypothetical protein